MIFTYIGDISSKQYIYTERDGIRKLIYIIASAAGVLVSHFPYDTQSVIIIPKGIL